MQSTLDGWIGDMVLEVRARVRLHGSVDPRWVMVTFQSVTERLWASASADPFVLLRVLCVVVFLAVGSISLLLALAEDEHEDGANEQRTTNPANDTSDNSLVLG